MWYIKIKYYKYIHETFFLIKKKRKKKIALMIKTEVGDSP